MRARPLGQVRRGASGWRSAARGTTSWSHWRQPPGFGGAPAATPVLPVTGVGHGRDPHQVVEALIGDQAAQRFEPPRVGDRADRRAGRSSWCDSPAPGVMSLEPDDERPHIPRRARARRQARVQAILVELLEREPAVVQPHGQVDRREDPMARHRSGVRIESREPPGRPGALVSAFRTASQRAEAASPALSSPPPRDHGHHGHHGHHHSRRAHARR